MIQKPKIKILDRATIFLKNTSPNSYFFQNLKSISKIWTIGSAKTGQPVIVPENGP